MLWMLVDVKMMEGFRSKFPSLLVGILDLFSFDTFWILQFQDGFVYLPTYSRKNLNPPEYWTNLTLTTNKLGIFLLSFRTLPPWMVSRYSESRNKLPTSVQFRRSLLSVSIQVAYFSIVSSVLKRIFSKTSCLWKHFKVICHSDKRLNRVSFLRLFLPRECWIK